MLDTETPIHSRMTAHELAALLKCQDSTVIAAIKRGELIAEMVRGKYVLDEESVRQYVSTRLAAGRQSLSVSGFARSANVPKKRVGDALRSGRLKGVRVGHLWYIDPHEDPEAFGRWVRNGAPQTFGTPTECGACRSATGNIVGHVRRRDALHLGYLCTKCNSMVQACEGDLVRARQVLLYLEKVKSASTK